MKYNNMTRIIELFEKVVIGDEVHLIAECNDWEGGYIVNHLSRSPFVYPATMIDDDIKNDIQNGAYSIYFY